MLINQQTEVTIATLMSEETQGCIISLRKDSSNFVFVRSIRTVGRFFFFRVMNDEVGQYGRLCDL